MSEYNEKVEQALYNVTEAGRYKFMVHSAKGSWVHKHIETLLTELKREVEELEEAVLAGKTKESIVSEIGDVVNYAAMLLDKVITK